MGYRATGSVVAGRRTIHFRGDFPRHLGRAPEALHVERRLRVAFAALRPNASGLCTTAARLSLPTNVHLGYWFVVGDNPRRPSDLLPPPRNFAKMARAAERLRAMRSTMRKIFLRYGAAALILGFLAIHVLDVTAQEASAKKEIRVYVDRQILLAFDGGKQIYRFDVVTGKEGKETVAGTYKIFRKEQKYISKTYNAEMP